MYPIKIKYVDFDGTERLETFYFNMTKAELRRWATENSDNAAERLKELTDAKRFNLLMDTIEDLIARAYGERTPDGRKFVKNAEIRDAFMASEAYSQLFTEFFSNDEANDGSKLRSFIEGIMPSDVMAEVNREIKEDPANKLVEIPTNSN